MKVRVSRKARETADIATFELVSEDGSNLPSFTAGAHIDVNLPDGMIRQYSLCSAQEENSFYSIGILNDPDSRGGSRAMHEQVNEGDDLIISEPRNHFPLEEKATKTMLFGGGIGITPILCMADRLAAIGADFEMHYCTRSLGHTAFRSRIAESSYASNVMHHLDDGPSEQKLDLQALLSTPQEGVHIYVCGPTGFMDAVLGTAREAGWPEGQIHFEFFGAEIVQQEGDDNFEVELSKSGKILTVKPDQTVVEVLAAAGVEVKVSCEQGVCGTCLTKVIEGIPDHRDLYLTPNEQEQNNSFLPCCSRSKSPRLVIEL
ncbi:MAG: 2Fe-2S iron-sulfur cluster-binding protein [Sphingorhabdus sp.]